jgi:hypothetical protein
MSRQEHVVRDYSEFFVAFVMGLGALVVMSKAELIPVGVLYLGLTAWLVMTAWRHRRRSAGLAYDGPAWRAVVFVVLWYLVGPALGAITQSRFADETDGWAAGLGVWWACILVGYLLVRGQRYRQVNAPVLPGETQPFE